MYIPNYVNVLIQELDRHGYEAYVVGGAVRSALLNQPVHDYDLTTNALPMQMKEVFKRYHCIETGIQHGTLTVMSSHHPIEITTYRKDSTYKDHRHPDSVAFTSALQEDCQRRDFTINAMCYRPNEGILDFFHGKQDLEDHIIRCIGDPKKRFSEDALRILRALRFAARLSFTIEPETARVLRALKDTLRYVSTERITEEFNGILKSTGCASCLMDYQDVIAVFLPEILEIQDYAKVIHTLQNEHTASPEIRLALLLYPLHDTNRVHTILKRMKYANTFQTTVKDLLTYADSDLTTPIAMRHVLSRMKVDIDTYLAFRSALQEDFDSATARILYTSLVNDAYCWHLQDLAVNGKDLTSLGYKGPAVGEALHCILEAVMDEKVPNHKVQLLSFLNNIHKQ